VSHGRVPVKRTAKLYIKGEFPRSESGRSYEVFSHDGRLLAWAARASRKDLRDAVKVARAAQPGWAGKTAYNRGQILYRVAELMEGRRAQFEAELADAGAADPRRGVDASIDRWVWYAGWADKIGQALGGTNPVAGPYFNFTIPEPTGVVGIVAPQEQSLLGLVSRLAPAIVSGGYLPSRAVSVAPISASGFMMRSIGRADSESSPTITVVNGCAASMPESMRMVEPELPASSVSEGARSPSRPRP